MQVAKGSGSAIEGSSHDSGMGSLDETVKVMTAKKVPPAVKPKPKSKCCCEFTDYLRTHLKQIHKLIDSVTQCAVWIVIKQSSQNTITNSSTFLEISNQSFHI